MVEGYRLEAVVDMVGVDPEAAAEVAAITPLHYIRIKVYTVRLETASSAMVIKGQHTRCGRLGIISSTVLEPYTSTISSTN